jgi:superfamily II DNA helicase RecQ
MLSHFTYHFHVVEVSSLLQKQVLVVSFTSDTPVAERQEVCNLVLHHNPNSHRSLLQITDDLSSGRPAYRLLYSTPVFTLQLMCRCQMYWLLVTPEKLCTAEFLRLLDGIYGNGELNRLVVDEVKNCRLSYILC